MKRPTRSRAASYSVGRLDAEGVHAAVHVGIGVGVEVDERVDDLRGFWRGRRIVEIDQRTTIDLALKDGKVGANRAPRSSGRSVEQCLAWPRENHTKIVGISNAAIRIRAGWGRLGILGGGQLGRMTLQAASRLGIDVVIAERLPIRPPRG